MAGFQTLFELQGLWLPLSPLIPRKGCVANVTMLDKHRHDIGMKDKRRENVEQHSPKRKDIVI